MTKPKTLEQLRAEKERAETQLLQEQHKLERLENRKKYLEKGERTKRTHRLCNLGGTIESLMIQLSIFTYQFFPLLVITAFTESILALHQTTTSSVSKNRFLLMRSTPNSVVCNLSKFFSNSSSAFIL